MNSSGLLQEKLEMHFSGYKTLHMHNLTELVQATLAINVCSHYSSSFA